MKDLTGTRLGQYEIVERLGGGGMAVVYRAVQQPLGREIALKALSSELFQDDGFVKRFETEAKTLAKLDHPNILPIYDFEVMDGSAFLTMPLIRGGTLRDVLNRGPLDTLSAWRYLREIGDGLQHAHDAGIIHRDLKPTNVLIHTDGRAMLADFGLARGAGQPTHLTTVGLAIGTPGYMAPEQVMGHDVDRRADIYAMGVLTFEMLTGRLPFTGANRMEVAYAPVNPPIPSAAKLNAVLPDELDVLLARVLAKDPAQRPQSVKDLLAQMAKLPQRRATATAGAPAAAAVARPAATPSPQPADAAAIRLASVPPPHLHGSPPPTPSTGSSTGSSAIRTLQMMGVKPARARGRFILNSHVANLIHVARDVTGVRWSEIAYTAGLAQYVDQDPPNDEQLATPVEYLGRLNEAFETIYAAEAEDQLRAWVATIEAILRWAGLANDWYVEEVECGCVTGTFDCVFAIRSVES